ncbi:hypothetical protein C7B65_07575 [Phormidesmis priestleyi ULC007]|uniref:Uncharacterized protein n=1 Tax=Phormidesmis priestleyi ULC007 TaxID=1920490 RepID=A0A2T1DII7_9CYAN|nr:hypothetical protein [Phormidesmis priestleyi]PSB20297.1 hypothetical protein C7B65_07575 [Phormidesmis priestleyi ULC007]PZO50166.1 MAG: hypothetical protein DCF14_12205 [Phormidesmis priestleyi]
MKPDFTAMSGAELRAYVLQHRNDTEAIHALIDRLVADPNATTYAPEDADRFSEIHAESQSRHREQAS